MPLVSKYNVEHLQEFSIRDGATLVGDYANVKIHDRITFACRCSASHTKTYHSIIYGTGLLCNACALSEGKLKAKKTNIEKYGTTSPMQNKDILIKTKATRLERYGTTNLRDIPGVNEKIAATNIEKYGAANPYGSSIIRQKCKETLLKNHGVDSPSKSEVIRNKQRETMVKTYGVANPQQSQVIREKTSATNLERYGVTNPLQNADVLEKIKKTNIEKYGADNPFKSEIIKEKIKSTLLEKYGVNSPLKNPTIQAKLEATSMQRYGTRRPSENIAIKTKIKEAHDNMTEEDRNLIKQKVINTSLQRYGTQSPNQAAIVKEHKVESSLKKFGTEYPMQNLEVQVKSQKNAFRRKEFTMPSGATRIVQGYEPFALRDLLQANFTEDQIVTDREAIPRIEYTANNKTRYYFPDIFIPHINKIIEVKSTWTHACTTDNITQKAEASKAAGYDYETWVYDGKGQRITLTSASMHSPSGPISAPGLGRPPDPNHTHRSAQSPPHQRHP